MCFVTHTSHVELVKSLLDFGLTNTEAFVFEAALNLGEATTRQISIAAGKERAQTYHVVAQTPTTRSCRRDVVGTCSV